jgi:hypothetical protein
MNTFALCKRPGHLRLPGLGLPVGSAIAAATFATSAAAGKPPTSA